MLGGENSFGAGGWANTELEQAMPVDFQIKNAKVVPVGALAMVMHASEMPQGNYWQTRDRQGGDQGSRQPGLLRRHSMERHRPLAVEARHGQSRRESQGDARRARSHDPRRHAGLRSRAELAAARLQGVPDAAVKHMIVISDGDPWPPTAAVVNALNKEKIKVSTVAVGTHGPPSKRRC